MNVDALVTIGAVNALLWAMIAYESLATMSVAWGLTWGFAASTELGGEDSNPQ